jgi:RNA polymerase sigma-70 factor (ECF subfamily)
MDTVTEQGARGLVAAAGASSFERAYLDNRLPVYRYLRTFARSEDAAADLTAVTFERAFVSFARFDASRPLLPWLLRIARNAALDGARRARPLVRLEDLYATGEPAAATTPEDEAVRAEGDAELRALVAALPDPQRDAVALRYAVGLTAREIGSVIGKSEEATQKILSRALGALRETLDAQR